MLRRNGRIGACLFVIGVWGISDLS